MFALPRNPAGAWAVALLWGAFVIMAVVIHWAQRRRRCGEENQ